MRRKSDRNNSVVWGSGFFDKIDITKYEKYEEEPFAACENHEVPYAKWVLKNIPKPNTVLDVGCGVGIHTKWFNDNGMKCWGITINKAEIEKRVSLHVQYGNMCCIPYSNDGFDLVFCLGSLEHTIVPYIALCEFNRVLKDGGYLFFNMPPLSNLQFFDKDYFYHKTVLFPIQVKDLLLKTGFELVNSSVEDNIEYNSAGVAVGYGCKQVDAPDNKGSLGVYLSKKTRRII